MTPLLNIRNLEVTSDRKKIIQQCSLHIRKGEVHIIMGPNGSGKSTLCHTIMGHPQYRVTRGSMKFNDVNLQKLSPTERAKLGLFLAFQYPQALPGVSLGQVMRATAHSMPLPKLKQALQNALQSMQLAEEFATRSLNEHASGGEKKRLEMVQLMLLKPKLAILDEIDSGIDIDALKLITQAINEQRAQQKTSFLIITHYPRLLQHLTPDRVHIMMHGRIVHSGDSTLGKQLEQEGYAAFEYTHKLTRTLRKKQTTQRD
ncbi:MAG: Fe-S cluster assembly ATPase SufC [Candidatus Kerfeldbacteria bacterium RIFCSPHIGHO2_02_FULL_42_14]|uniref:Fe-S cluster assembly ATPase SufC n=1 Tax=Candidatus Kerfeldbacteria bacterium RIFCSPHIGHO2_02_FULL_42_14 TaxID=1798540 RepID=A0A1G2ASX7_9BACT|nr:MAG: Fe-S cluster assembly ATPase SufC [Candidatus Kerfeldbacteria bacterium RIFCSPHIGHO2_02_FULL_42_14]OGY81617.1 MAG: Fe-S cluster assembly ATPase SufC [Candidatus Kerfeldbacteria bacterium RIFCSPHIGHO2_12_FULL_42_13]OGY83219.1 MAG: Fe-S cluster assembly ATPase SufC [Candidatus Kerfeldbacteria bacterium RIFCSPLOWO2_02_FULL_42_19]OGY85524.1 MAG: Fe-S cluster assembly ATPase SufC [Candidatus Kerfeldbacteria bacterium RIFCSPLOWO2_12_FULL_43_9]